MLDEHEIIQCLRRLADNPLKDDAALYDVPAGKQLVVTTDMLVENIHFPDNGAPHDIAYRAFATNLSDLAAMGAEPYCSQLALGLSAKQRQHGWISGFCDGIKAVQDDYGIRLSGGDVVSGAPCLTISITAHGLIEEGAAISRSNAQIGDHIYVTGTLGDAMLGLDIIQEMQTPSPEFSDYCKARFWRPTPRLSIGQGLVGLANAMMDISDGIILDCKRLCAASSVRAELWYDALPLSEAMKHFTSENPELVKRYISAGDDYELLFTASPHKHDDVMALGGVTHVGVMVDGEGYDVSLIEKVSGQTLVLLVEGYKH